MQWTNGTYATVVILKIFQETETLPFTYPCTLVVLAFLSHLSRYNNYCLTDYDSELYV